MVGSDAEVAGLDRGLTVRTFGWRGRTGLHIGACPARAPEGVKFCWAYPRPKVAVEAHGRDARLWKSGRANGDQRPFRRVAWHHENRENANGRRPHSLSTPNALAVYEPLLLLNGNRVPLG